jgi:hypothetical protein
MKKMSIVVLSFFIMLNVSLITNAQTLEKENTYTLTGKAKKGALGDVTFDADKGTYTLTYVTKSNDRLVKFQIYTFDRDFNFISMTEDEIEFEKARTKYKWFNYKGEEYFTEGLYVEPNLVGTLVLKKKRVTYKYDWFLLGYYKEIDILEKVKPKTDDGKKYYYLGHAEDDVTGEVLILCGIKDNINKDADAYRQFKDFVVLKYNQDVDLVGETAFKLNYPNNLAFSKYIGNDEGGVAGMSFVFAPMGGQGMGKVADPDFNNFTYVRVNASPEVVDNIPFKSFAPYWKINELIHDETTDDIYLYGPSALGKDKYYNQLLDETKFKAVQLLKVSDHKVAYFTETDLPEFDAKLKKPSDQKKTPSYDGKKFQIANYLVPSNGDFFVSGQNFNTSNEGNKYNDILGFHFDSKGDLKAQYSVDTKESNKYAKAAGTEQLLIENAKGDKVYWVHFEIVGVSMARGKMLSYPSIGNITLKDGSISTFTAYGGEEGFYLDPTFPFLETDKGNTIAFFGSGKSGKEIWFVRVRLD